MGLRLSFRLIARGPLVSDDAGLVVDLLTLLEQERLLAPGHATLTVTGADGVPEAESEPLPLPRLRERLAGLRARHPRAVEIRGLRTADGFPNPFWQYTIDQEVLSSWIHVRFVGAPAGERLFEIEFAEPDFLSDTPVFSPYRLVARLKTVAGTTLTPECESMEVAPG